MNPFLFGADWAWILAYNLRTAGALWAAWAGGASTVLHHGGEIRLCASIDRDRGESEPPRPKLTLVPLPQEG